MVRRKRSRHRQHMERCYWWRQKEAQDLFWEIFESCGTKIQSSIFPLQISQEAETVEKFVTNLKLLVREWWNDSWQNCLWSKLSPNTRKVNQLRLDSGQGIARTYEMSHKWSQWRKARKSFTTAKEIDDAERRPRIQRQKYYSEVHVVDAEGLTQRIHAQPWENMPKVQESKPLRQHVQNKKPAGTRGQW